MKIMPWLKVRNMLHCNSPTAKWLVGSSLLLLALLMRCGQAPRSSYASLEPSTAYVGTEACASCHADIHQQYQPTNMGHSFYRPSLSDTIERFGPEAVVYDSLRDFYYQPFWRGEDFFVREWRMAGADTSYLREERVDYVIGSGHQTRSYLMQREGYLYELPITWYVHRGIWDLSPGYREQNARFSREIGAECMACHTGTFDYVAGSKNRFRQLSLGIGCENCHGPGQAHVALRQAGEGPPAGEVDYSIVNPADLPMQARFDICSRCHLEGVAVPQPGRDLFDYRPGMPLQQVMEIFVMQNRDRNAFGVASHAERLMQSRCFIASEGQMTCTTCHDAHGGSGSLDTYLQQCQSCHQADEAGMCLAPESAHLSAEQNCVSCHMPVDGTVDIPHVRFHDHKIRVLGRGDSLPAVAEAEAWLELKCGTSAQPTEDAFGQAWLLYYEQQQTDPRYLQRAARQLDPASHYARARVAFYQGDLSTAEREARQALEKQPEEPLRRFLLGEILEGQGRYAEAQAAYQQVYQQNIHSFEAGLKSAITLLKARQGDPQALTEARTRFEALREQKPFDLRVLTNLGFVALNQRRLSEAERFLVLALQQDPDDAQALENMVLLQMVKGNALRANRYLDHLSAQHPAHPSLSSLRGMVGEG